MVSVSPLTHLWLAEDLHWKKIMCALFRKGDIMPQKSSYKGQNLASLKHPRDDDGDSSENN